MYAITTLNEKNKIESKDTCPALQIPQPQAIGHQTPILTQATGLATDPDVHCAPLSTQITTSTGSNNMDYHIQSPFTCSPTSVIYAIICL